VGEIKSESWARSIGISILTGMSLVGAMAIQNAAHRIHLGQMPPTTLMTGTTTQMMIDIADLFHGIPQDTKDLAVARLTRMSKSVVAFAAGCAAAALFYCFAREWCFTVPPVLGAMMLTLKVA